MLAKRIAATSLVTMPRAQAQKPTACLAGPQSSKFRYRRSTLTKAPRKRTFVANMEKYLIDAARASNLACASSTCADARTEGQCCQPAFGGSDNGNGGRFDGVQRTFDGGDNGFNGQGNTLTGALLAAAVAVVIVLSPNLGAVAKTMGSPAARSTVCNSSLCLSNSGSRLAGKPVRDDAIVYGQVALTAQERRMLNMGQRQLRYREAIRV